MKSTGSVFLTCLVMFAISCTSDSQVIDERVNIPSTSPIIEKDQNYIDEQIAAHQYNWGHVIPYTIDFDFEFVEVGVYALNATVIPDEGSYIISNTASDKFRGKLAIIMDNENITLVDDLREIPPSGKIFEPFEQENTRAITERTICAQKIKLNTTKDFQFDGLVQFTIEPKCTFEKNHFTINQKNGILSVVKKG